MKRKVAAPPLPTQFSGPANSPGFLLWRVSECVAAKATRRLATLEARTTPLNSWSLAVATWFGATEVLTQVRLAELSLASIR